MTTTTKNATQWIEALNLEPHPEGGFYRETHRSRDRLHGIHLPERYGSSRTFSTVIYYLLRSQDISHLHKLKSDEFWFFHTGSPLIMHCINANGEYSTIRLADDGSPTAEFQAVIPHDTWFGAEVEQEQSFSLVSCVVAPGFDFQDFEMADREELLMLCPDHHKVIHQLTRS